MMLSDSATLSFLILSIIIVICGATGFLICRRWGEKMWPILPVVAIVVPIGTFIGVLMIISVLARRYGWAGGAVIHVDWFLLCSVVATVAGAALGLAVRRWQPPKA